ncbi:hypothetical protein EVAR_39480_1 [Eumeta japonica]|uniref:Uncharacterized protein n=1 Tax=Eumeta variegata TaxID=151549 RepID=A0A4C1W049_EUMVA|nr:hypothetical protein EVAR_39480_1 [Eumeta japonica]
MTIKNFKAISACWTYRVPELGYQWRRVFFPAGPFSPRPPASVFVFPSAPLSPFVWISFDELDCAARSYRFRRTLSSPGVAPSAGRETSCIPGMIIVDESSTRVYWSHLIGRETPVSAGAPQPPARRRRPRHGVSEQSHWTRLAEDAPRERYPKIDDPRARGQTNGGGATAKSVTFEPESSGCGSDHDRIDRRDFNLIQFKPTAPCLVEHARRPTRGPRGGPARNARERGGRFTASAADATSPARARARARPLINLSSPAVNEQRRPVRAGGRLIDK